MACSGHCFDFTSIQDPGSFHGLIEETLQASTNHITGLYTYNQLKPWQTRVLRLHSSEFSRQLSADLLVATVCDIGDLLVESTGATVKYTALSYSWGRPELSETLICNEKKLPISRSNAAALIALRSPTEPIYVWIDAICINQEDDQEKSTQVARMLNIYQKAELVKVWLGEPNADSLLAFACIHRLSELREMVTESKRTKHVPSCYDRMRKITRALLSLYIRPWLRRVWIRQEIYGARQLIIVCGLQQISWEGFIGGARVMKSIRSMIEEEGDNPDPRETDYDHLLIEAARNANLPPSGVKSPRDLTEILLQTPSLEASEPRDTFYAILGMCGVVAISKLVAQRLQDTKVAVLVDYEKSLVDVYRDATSCVLHRKGSPDKLANLWHSYRRGQLHIEGLPSWAVDWRSGIFEDNYREDLTRLMGSDDLQTPIKSSLGESYGQSTLPDELEGVTRSWHWPEPLESDPGVLRLRARVLNYVAYLTDFTCEPGVFAKDGFKSLGSITPAIYRTRMPGDSFVGTPLVYHNAKWKSFNPVTDPWRLAILGVGNDSQLCLVPSSTRKGDLIVAIAPGLLAMVISPMQNDSTFRNLISIDNPYEGITTGPLQNNRAFRIAKSYWGKLTLMLLPFTVVFHILWYNSSAKTTILSFWYGTVLLVSLLGYLTMHHLYALHFFGNSNMLFLASIFLILQIEESITVLFCTELLEKKRQTFPCIYTGVTAAAWVVGEFWRAYRQVHYHMELGSHRRDVFKSLDNITETLGRNYRFHSPILVRRYTPCKLPDINPLLLLSLCICSQVRQHFRIDHLEMKSAIEAGHGGPTQGNEEEWALDRPIQEFRLY